jgi:SAM-dependent methyltransferase
MAPVNNDAKADDWDRHWSEYHGSARTNPAQEYRRRLLLANLALDPATSPRVLDIGSGTGDFLVDLNAVHPGIPKLGLEMSQSGVEISTRRLAQARFLQRDLIAGNDAPGEYSAFATHAVCSEVLEHVDDPVRLLRNAKPYMADGCRLVVTVPGGPRSAFDAHIGHRRHFTAADLRSVLTDAGFAVEATTGAGFPFFNLYRLMVILRGKRLVEDAAGEPGALLRISSAVFDLLFKLNMPRSSFGWQTIGVAYKRS